MTSEHTGFNVRAGSQMIADRIRALGDPEGTDDTMGREKTAPADEAACTPLGIAEQLGTPVAAADVPTHGWRLPLRAAQRSEAA